jgi:hypothetical protein
MVLILLLYVQITLLFVGSQMVKDNVSLYSGDFHPSPFTNSKPVGVFWKGRCRCPASGRQKRPNLNSRDFSRNTQFYCALFIFCLCSGTLLLLPSTKELPMNEIFFLVEEDPEGGFAAKALGESIFTGADSLEDLHINVRDAVRCHFEEGKAPKMIRLHFVHEEVLAV